MKCRMRIWTPFIHLLFHSLQEKTFAYQDGPDSAANMVTETVPGECSNSGGTRYLIIPGEDLLLQPFLFGSCDMALPEGVDVTDLEGTIIFGSNDDQPWIDGSSGSGSPPDERIEKLIDNDVYSKYLVRDVTSWVEIQLNRYTKLNGYTISSANDEPTRDPKDWSLRGWNEASESWEILHTVTNNPVWESRYKMRVWSFENENWYYKYRLDITAINGNSQGLMQMAELQLFGELGDLTGIMETTLPGIRIYPNPALDHLNIKFNGQQRETRLRILDLTGKKVFEERIHPELGSIFRVDLEDYSPGIYLLQILNGNRSLTKRFLVR